MAIKIDGTDVIDNNQRGIFLKVNPGVYTTSARNALSASAGDVIYNSDDEELQVWTGTEWKSAGSAPQPTINNVTLSEDVDDSIRFQSKGFTANVIMDPESNPVSQKGVKALLSGNFPVYKESGAISNVSTTSSVSLNYSDVTGSSFTIGDPTDGFGGSVTDKRIEITLSCPTTRGGGNGPGYWVWNQNLQTVERSDEPGTEFFFGNFSKSYTQDLTGPTKLVIDTYETFEGDTVSGSVSSSEFNTNALRLQILNNIVWLEYSSAFDSSGHLHAWDDTNGNGIFPIGKNRSDEDRNAWGHNYCQTSDGEQLYWARWEPTSYTSHISGNNRIVIGSRKKTSGGTWNNGITVSSGVNDYDITGSSVSNVTHLNIVYHKPSNRLVLYYIKDNSSSTSYCRSYSIDNSIEGNGRLTFLTQVSQTITNLIQMTYCGDDGSYITTQSFQNPEVIYKYDSVQSKFVVITTPTYITPSDKEGSILISGIGDGIIYASGYTFDPTGGAFPGEGYRFYLWRSTNEGTTWVRNSVLESNTPNYSFDNIRALGMGPSNELLQTYYRSSFNSPQTSFARVNILTDRTQTVTVPLATNFANGEVVAKKGDQYNPGFIGTVTNKSGSNFEITSRQAYSNGDELINLSDFTQSSTTKYLKLSSGNTYTALGIEEEDFGFTSVGTTTGIGITFPANLSSGNLTDQQIPAGTGLSVIVQASNGTEISTFTSNTVFPS